MNVPELVLQRLACEIQRMAFKVKFTDQAETVPFDDNDTFRLHESGVLEIRQSDRTVTLHAPHAWAMLEDKDPARGMAGFA